MNSTDEIVKIAISHVLGKLAVLSKLLLEKNLFLNSKTESSTSHYDLDLRLLQASIQTIISKLISQNNSTINIALCKNLSLFADFFNGNLGDTILSKFLSLLKTSDPDIKIEFLNHLPKICSILQKDIIKKEILNNLITLLIDSNEYVIMTTLETLRKLFEENVFDNESMMSLITETVCLLL